MIEGQAYIDNLGVGAWDEHIDTLVERANTMAYIVQKRPSKFVLTSIVEQYRSILLKRARARYEVLSGLYQGFTNPDWWRSISRQEMQQVYSYLMALLEKETNTDLVSVLGEAAINSMLPDIASESLDLAKMLTYMYITGVSVSRLLEAVSLWVDVEKFLGGYGIMSLNVGGDCVAQHSSPHLMASNDLIETWSGYWSLNEGYKVCNVRFLLHHMADIVRDEIEALEAGDYEKYIKLLSVEKKYAERILEVLDKYGMAKLVDKTAYTAFIETSASWSSGLLYIETRHGIEQLYALLADTWLFEYTHILEGEAKRPPYRLKLYRVYWLPAADISIVPKDEGYRALIRLSVGANYMYRGGLSVEVYAVYNIFGIEYERRIAGKELDSIKLDSGKDLEITITFSKDKLLWLNPIGYRVKVYAINPLIVDEVYTIKLKQSVEGVEPFAANVYEKYFSKMLIGAAEVAGDGRPITSGHLVRLDESQHKLYLAVVTGDGRVVGYRDGRVVVEVPEALFLDLGNGTQLAYLPLAIAGYTIVIEASNASQPLEEYNLTIISSNGSVRSEARIAAAIERGEVHKLVVSSSGGHMIVEPLDIELFEVIHTSNAEIAIPKTKTAIPTTTPSTTTPRATQLSSEAAGKALDRTAVVLILALVVVLALGLARRRI